MDHPYDEAKFREVLLYVAKRLESDPTGGATKLNKVLFFADFAHMREHGRPITGAEYQKLPWGPAPRRLLPVRDQMVADDEMEFVRDEQPGFRQDRLRPLREPNEAVLSSSERKQLDDALDKLRGKTAAQASNLSHEEWGWQAGAEGQTIPYETAVLLPPAMTDRIKSRAAGLAAELSTR